MTNMNQKHCSTLLCFLTIICVNLSCFGYEIDPSWKKYENTIHGFSFHYPNNYQLSDKFETKFTKSGEVVCLDFFGSSFRTEVSVAKPKNYEWDHRIDFLNDAPYVNCASDGDCSGDCKIIQTSPLSGGDFQGLRYEVERVTTCVDQEGESPDTVYRERLPPSFGFNISSGSTISVLFFRTEVLSPTENDLYAVFNTLKRIPINAQPSVPPDAGTIGPRR